MYRLTMLLLLIFAAAGCTGETEEATQDQEIETADPAIVEGLTPQEIRERAEPISPEQAEQLGIIDTTIHIEDPRGSDTILDVDNLP